MLFTPTTTLQQQSTPCSNSHGSEWLLCKLFMLHISHFFANLFCPHPPRFLAKHGMKNISEGAIGTLQVGCAVYVCCLNWSSGTAASFRTHIDLCSNPQNHFFANLFCTHSPRFFGKTWGGIIYEGDLTFSGRYFILILSVLK